MTGTRSVASSNAREANPTGRLRSGGARRVKKPANSLDKIAGQKLAKSLAKRADLRSIFEWLDGVSHQGKKAGRDPLDLLQAFNKIRESLDKTDLKLLAIEIYNGASSQDRERFIDNEDAIGAIIAKLKKIVFKETTLWLESDPELFKTLEFEQGISIAKTKEKNTFRLTVSHDRDPDTVVDFSIKSNLYTLIQAKLKTAQKGYLDKLCFPRFD